MDLRVYLKMKNITMADFCKSIGANVQYITRIMNGYMKPGKRLAKDIRIMTEGLVDLTQGPIENLKDDIEYLLSEVKKKRELLEKLEKSYQENEGMLTGI